MNGLSKRGKLVAAFATVGILAIAAVSIWIAAGSSTNADTPVVLYDSSAGGNPAQTEFQTADAGASPGQDFGAAIAALTDSPSATVATVNGVPISIGKVKAYMVLSSTGRKLGQVTFDKPVAEYVNGLIESELLFQEAQRRGLVPSDAVVQASATQTKTGLLEFMKQDTQDAKNLRDVFAQVKGTPYGIDAYDSGVMLDSFRHTLAIGAARTAISDELPLADVKDRAKRDAHVADVLAGLKAKAKIEVNPLP